MKKIIATALLSSCVAFTSSAAFANSLVVEVAPGVSFEQLLSITPSDTNRMVLTFSGLADQFESLGFEINGIATPFNGSYNKGNTVATFNDFRNNNFSLTGGQAYTVRVFGNSLSTLPGTVGKATVLVMNGNVVAVPEPESYAMFLAGLGIMGLVARRRQRQG